MGEGEGKSEQSGITSWKEEAVDPHDRPELLGTKPEHPGAVENKLPYFRSVFERTLPLLEQHPILDPYSSVNTFSEEIEGTKFEVHTPPLRRGKHAFVGLVDVTDPAGESFHAVIRNDPSDVEEYVQLVNDVPEAAGFLPDYFGSVGNWGVRERLYGLELQEVQWKMQQDPEFLERYTDQVLDTIQRTANADVALIDVAFIDGHNVLVDPETAKPRLIEQTNLDVYPFLNKNELVTRQLFRELQLAAFRTPDAVPVTYPMRLLQKAFERIPPHDLYLRRKVLTPTHRDYEERYEFDHGQKLTDEELAMRRTNADDPAFYIPEFQADHTEVFSRRLINAVQENDSAALEEILREKATTAFLTDMEDPRSAPIIFHHDGWS